MRLKFIFRFILFIILFSNCKEKKADSLTSSSNSHENTRQHIIVDSTNMFTSFERDSLIQKILSYEKKTSNEIAILTIDSLPKNTDIQMYSTNVAKTWNIGKKEKDNGLLITISKFDKKVVFSTGSGTEETLTDQETKVIIDRVLVPQFRNENYYKGVTKSLDSIFLLWD